MNKSDMKKALIKASIFTVVSMTIMLQRAATKHIMITDAAGISIDREYNEDSFELLIDKNVSKNQSGKLIIPLSKSVSSDNIVVEDRYMDHELLIYIDGREKGYYLDTAVITDLDIIKKAVCITKNDSGSVCLDFKLDGLYANESKLTESRTIEVEFFKPADKYENIVVVDPTDKNAIDVALDLKAVSEKNDKNIKFYYTSLDEQDVDSGKRESLIKDAQADLVVGISTDNSENSQGEGLKAYYNSYFFLRRMSNAEFAAVLAEECALKTGTKVNGVYTVDENDSVIMNSTVPSARISIGNVSNDASYKNRLASGLYEGILKACEVIK